MHETPEGFLLCVGVPIARTGEMEYGEGETPLETGDDGIIKISRSEDEVFRAQTIASFEGKPVTINHPNEFVTPDNWSRLAKGVTQNVRRGSGDQGDDLIADLLITDAHTIRQIKDGLREVSCGYEAEYTQTETGKGIQTNIIGNHVALVDQGRAGSQYSIKDHKGVTMDKKTLLEQLAKLFGKTKDKAALATVTKLVNDAAEEKPADKPAPSKDAHDAMMKACKDFMAAISGSATPSEAGAGDAEEEEEAPAADENSVEGRLKKMEDAVSSILEKMTAKDAAEEEPTVTDEEPEDGEESEDAEEGEEEEESEDELPTGDTKSRVEILAPGLEAKGKDHEIKAKALKTCYGTKDGKKIIEQLNGGKAPAFDSKEKVDMLFAAASEVLKAQRNRDLSKTRQVRDAELIEGTPDSRAMTAEKLNELNEKHYSKGAK